MPIRPYDNRDGMGSSPGKTNQHPTRGCRFHFYKIREASGLAECEDRGISLFILPPGPGLGHQSLFREPHGPTAPLGLPFWFLPIQSHPLSKEGGWTDAAVRARRAARVVPPQASGVWMPEPLCKAFVLCVVELLSFIQTLNNFSAANTKLSWDFNSRRQGAQA